jgi:DNA polymerase-3 subunit epsilon
MTREKYLTAFQNSWAEDAPAEQVRFVVLDTETTGLDPRRDRIITIGAVAVQSGEILLDDAFEALLKIAYNNSSVTVHGITRDEAIGGMEEAEALSLFLEYLLDGVIVGHHIGHDIEALNCACERHFQLKLKNRSLDTMDLTLNLKDAGALGIVRWRRALR